jgi:hypothetical protein
MASGTMERERDRTRDGRNGGRSFTQPYRAGGTYRDLDLASRWCDADDSDERAQVAQLRDGRIVIRSSFNHGEVVVFTRRQVEHLGRALNEDPQIRDLISA